MNDITVACVGRRQMQGRSTECIGCIFRNVFVDVSNTLYKNLDETGGWLDCNDAMKRRFTRREGSVEPLAQIVSSCKVVLEPQTDRLLTFFRENIYNLVELPLRG